MRILMIAKTLTAHRPGGFESHVTNLALVLTKAGHDVHVVCRKMPRTHYPFTVHDVPYLGIGVDAVDNLTSIPAFAKKLSVLLSSERFDVVHGHGITSQAYFRTGATLPFVYTLHGISSHHLVGYRQPLRAILKLFFDTERNCVAGADKIICVSRRIAGEAHAYYGVARSRCVAIPNGVVVKDFLPRTVRRRGTKRIGFVGYLHEHKGLRFLLDAMPHIVRAVPGAQLYVVGKGNATPFRNQATELGIEKSVHFLTSAGARKLAALYKTLDAFCLPSLYEGFGIAALEALASGVPLVVSDTGHLRSLAQGTGFVIEPRNTAQIAGRLTRILTDDALRKRLSQRCLKKAAAYDWKSIAALTARVYKDVVQSSK